MAQFPPASVTFEQLILQQRPHVERLIQELARQHFLAAAEVRELRETVERVLERNDYELLRAFDGRSTWETYLATVVTREFFLFRAALWGQWRPSPDAIRLGPAAMLLEELVVRDHFLLKDAVDWMRTTHRVDVPQHRLLRIAEQLGIAIAPAGRRRSAVPVTPPDPTLSSALRDALALISADDRLILELRFRDRQPLTRIASLLKVDARPLQRRIETVREVIRRSLLTQGIQAADVEALLATDSESAGAHQKWWDLVLTRPSKESGHW